MVYIKLTSTLYSRLKTLIEPSQLIQHNKQHYVPYPEFSTSPLIQKE